MKKVLVTGPRGFIGSHLVQLLALREDVKLSVLIRPSDESYNPPSKQIEVFKSDLTDTRAISNVIKNVDVVVNLAFDQDNAEQNIAMAETLGDAACAVGLECVIHISSMAVYEPLPIAGIVTERQPVSTRLSPYANIKLRQESIFISKHLNSNLGVIVLRPTIVYGPGDGVWSVVPARQVLTGKVLLPGNGQGNANLIHVGDLCNAIEKACFASADCYGKIYIISGNELITWLDYYQVFDDALEQKSVIPASDREIQQFSVGIENRIRESLSRPIRFIRFKTPKMMVNVVKDILPRVLYLPADAQKSLFISKCVLSSQRAQQDLSFSPSIRFSEGKSALSSYLRKKYI